MTKQYTWSFVIAGGLIFLAGAISLPVRKIKAWEEEMEADKMLDCEEGLPLPNGDVIHRYLSKILAYAAHFFPCKIHTLQL